MSELDIIYNKNNLIAVDPYQFKEFLFYWARNRQKFPEYMTTADDKSDDSALILLHEDRYLFVYPSYPDPRWYHPKIDTDLWDNFKQLNPKGAAPVL